MKDPDLRGLMYLGSEFSGLGQRTTCALNRKDLRCTKYCVSPGNGLRDNYKQQEQHQYVVIIVKVTT
jgi:hypothetical protein